LQEQNEKIHYDVVDDLYDIHAWMAIHEETSMEEQFPQPHMEQQ
jgi:hypothetical protein